MAESFDLQDPQRTRLVKSPVLFDVDFGDEDVQAVPSHPLDAPEMVALHGRLMAYYRQELDRQYENRSERALDEDFYDGDQWKQEDLNILEERGQDAITYNVIAQSVNWVIGSEKRGRVDFKILPRGKDDLQAAQRKTQLLKYLSDVNRSPFSRSRAFEDAAKSGLGWLEDGYSDDDDGEPIYCRYESWRNMLHDSTATELDLSDARYLFRMKWADEDIAVACFPDRAGLISMSTVDHSVYAPDLQNGDEIMDFSETEAAFSVRGFAVDHVKRPRLRLIEAWFRMPEKVQRFRAGRFQGEVLRPDDAAHAFEQQFNPAALIERTMMRMYVAIMTTEGLLYVAPSPYRHNRYPFTPIWAYRRGRDNMPYGLIRNMRGMQEDINKRASKALHILNTNKTIMEEGAVDDMDEFMEEVSRVDGVIVKKANKMLEINTDRELAPAHLDIMARSISMIQQVSGITDEMMGRTTNAKSGVAIQARQDQGSLSTSKLFDNLRFAHQVQGEKQLSLAEQFMTERKQFRITDMRGNPEFIDINDGLPENDITRSQADFVIGEEDWRATIRQAQVDQLIEMLSRMPPQVGLTVLDLVVDSMDIPNRDEIAKRIRALNGQKDPDQTEPTEEDLQRQQQQEQQAQQQAIAAKAQLDKLQSETAKNNAAAAASQADADLTRANVVKLKVDAQADAVTAAQTAMMAPGILPVADAILAEAGFDSADGQAAEQALQQQQQQPAGMPPQQQPMPAEQPQAQPMAPGAPQLPQGDA